MKKVSGRKKFPLFVIDFDVNDNRGDHMIKAGVVGATVGGISAGT